MRSKVAAALAREQVDRIAALAPAERLTLLHQMKVEGLAIYMSAHAVDRRTAITRIRATRRLGRRPSVSASADEY